MRTILVLSLALAACHRAPDAASLPQTIADSTLRAPDGFAVPGGELGKSILRGHAILAATGDSLPAHVGASLRCVSCHLGDGRREGALPLTGVYARYPQFRSRTATVQRLEDRVNDCFVRSLNGTALALDDPAMRDIISYFAFISRGVPIGDSANASPSGPTSGDTVAGARVFVTHCTRCHGMNGAGQGIYPPLWGAKSFNIGAGMARLRTARAFIQHNMPFDMPGSLNDVDALNVAAYVTSRPRPDLPGKERDWPRGDAPEDTPYATTAGRRP